MKIIVIHEHWSGDNVETLSVRVENVAEPLMTFAQLFWFWYSLEW